MRRIFDILAGFEALPMADITSLLQGRRALILAPHPDDESLGCGGLIAAACDDGVAPVVIVLTDGAASHPGSKTWPPRKLAKLREQETLLATRQLGLPPENLHFFRQPDTELGRDPDVFETLVDQAGMLGRQQGCGIVIGPWEGDPHCDHQAAARIAASVAERFGWTLLSYPVWGWLRGGAALAGEHHHQGWRLDISPYLERKKQAIAAHASQYGDLITDSPNGFRLPQELLTIFERPFEVFIA